MKIRTREKINPKYVRPEDTIELTYGSQVLLSQKITRKMTINELLIFDVEKGDFGMAKDGIGGVFLST